MRDYLLVNQFSKTHPHHNQDAGHRVIEYGMVMAGVAWHCPDGHRLPVHLAPVHREIAISGVRLRKSDPTCQNVRWPVTRGRIAAPATPAASEAVPAACTVRAARCPRGARNSTPERAPPEPSRMTCATAGERELALLDRQWATRTSPQPAPTAPPRYPPWLSSPVKT